MDLGASRAWHWKVGKIKLKSGALCSKKVSYNHAYRYFTKEEDVLSKKALKDQNQRGAIIYTQWEDNKQGPFDFGRF